MVQNHETGNARNWDSDEMRIRLIQENRELEKLIENCRGLRKKENAKPTRTCSEEGKQVMKGS